MSREAIILIVLALILILIGLAFIAIRLIKIEDAELEKYLSNIKRPAYYVADQFRAAGDSINNLTNSAQKKISGWSSRFKLK
ncbi:MAG: hypothetical protein H7Y00_07280 [Fimbriimonadaceae bacterium]|nr:hypothetical protein [Chitinophagales bacterium]